ncbi:probable G-protein coupled receptor Mth-like 10 [Amphiura filiformis]|uniref:probable G-protein coupled receptor Mth-like 10 n=1 Tax=Amphiura filiformis TaxID=82378 RepID=UPI003B20EF41
MVQRHNLIEVRYGEAVLTQDQFIYLPDGRILICAPPPVAIFSYSSGLAVANIVGTVTSLTGLAVTFGSHLALPELRNTHGISMMSLSASLFSAQLLPMLSDTLSIHGLLCTVFAAISHFAWLASFTWMSLIAANIAYVFAYRPFQSHERNATPTLMSSKSSHLLGWGIPSIIVVICLGFHWVQPEGIPFQYGQQQGVCWISNVKANLIFFGIPVFSSLVLNFLLFTWTSVVLYKTQRNSELSDECKIRAGDGQQIAPLFLKV